MPTHRRCPRGLDRVSPADKRWIRAALVARDEERCRGCEATDDLTIDHLVPASRGGSNALSNLQLLCAPCNFAKGDTLERMAA